MIDLKKTQINGKNSTFMDWKKLILLKYPYYPKASLIAQLVNHVPAMQEIQVQFLSQEDPLEKGNGNPPQYSSLENPIDRGACQVTVHGIARAGHDLATKPPPPPLPKAIHFELTFVSVVR